MLVFQLLSSPSLYCHVMSFFLSSSYLSRKSQPVWWSVPAAGAGLQPLEPGGLGVPSWGDWDRGSSRSHCMSEPSCWRICLSHMCNVSLPVAQRLKLSDFPGLLPPKPFYDSLIRCQWNRKVWMEIQVFHMVADIAKASLRPDSVPEPCSWSRNTIVQPRFVKSLFII